MSNTQIHVADPAIEQALADKMNKIALQENEQKTEILANQTGLGYINLVGFPIGPETISLIPKTEANRLKTVCFLRAPGQIRLGTTDPDQPELAGIRESLQNKFRAEVVFYLISEHSLAAALKSYDRLPTIRQTTNEIEIVATDLERFQQQIHSLKDLNEYLKKTNITDTFVLLLAGALRARASDVHIEAEAEEVRVRYRIDGALVTVADLDREQWPRIISRIKLMAGLKINITSTPQDGRITIYTKDDKIDIRVSVLPTSYGESVVMRLLRDSTTSITFDALGLTGKAYERLSGEINKPNGMVVITGPTGSGKTTTLYAILSRLNDDETKIITLEDPIEYKLTGINQSQVNWAKGYTFAQGLRSILRQDPDVVMVGEIRDLETADTAIQASLTGHLVLSTVHTNDAAGAIPRFLSMGTKPYLLAPSLNAVVAQRLVRKVCPHCLVDQQLDADALAKVKSILSAIPSNSKVEVPPESDWRFRRGQGCEQCGNLGYTGRIGVFEVLVVDESIEKVILDNQASEYQMRAAAQAQGMLTMTQDGLLKALAGVTTVDEVFRVAV